MKIEIPYLTENEKQRVQDKFLTDPVLVEAVKKVLLAGIYYNGTLRENEKAEPTRNFALTLFITALNKGQMMTNEELGADLRACGWAVFLLEDAFKQLQSLQKVDELPTTSKPTGR